MLSTVCRVGGKKIYLNYISVSFLIIHNANDKTIVLNIATNIVIPSLSTISSYIVSTSPHIGKKIPSANIKTNPAIAVISIGSIIVAILSIIY